jgi:hypothetical protein
MNGRLRSKVEAIIITKREEHPQRFTLLFGFDLLVRYEILSLFKVLGVQVILSLSLVCFLIVHDSNP